jgi:hypothetical protein
VHAKKLTAHCATQDEDMAKVSALNADARNGWGGPKVERGGGMEPRDLLHPLYPFRPGIAF